jgi:hypothetical protein
MTDDRPVPEVALSPAQRELPLMNILLREGLIKPKADDPKPAPVPQPEPAPAEGTR